MDSSGHLFALYICSTILTYLSWQLSDISKTIGKIRDKGNFLAIFLPFPIGFLEAMDYMPHGIHYTAFVKGYTLINESCAAIRVYYEYLPFIFFVFLFPKFRKSWKVSLIISLIAIPVVDFDTFSTWLYDIPDDFHRGDSIIDEALHMEIFNQRFNQCLDVFILLLFLILRIKEPITEEETIDLIHNSNVEN